MVKDDKKEEKFRHETLRQREAYEHYYALGDDRTLKQTATDYGVTERTVNNWSQWFGWRERVRQRDKEIADAMDRKMIDSYSTMKVEIVEALWYAMKESVLEPFKRGEKPLGIKNIGDFEKVVKMLTAFAGNRESEVEDNKIDKELPMPDKEKAKLKHIFDVYSMGGIENDTDGTEHHDDEFEEEDGFEIHDEDVEDGESKESG